MGIFGFGRSARQDILIDVEKQMRELAARSDARISELSAQIRNVEILNNLSSRLGGCGERELHARAMLIGSLLSPVSATGIRKVRIGSDNDGGYVMLDDIGRAQSALSFGIGDNDLWDTEIANQGLFVRQFDHTIEATPSSHANCRFYRKRIASVQTVGCETLGSLLKEVPEHERVIVKVDIEGDEWQIFEHVETSALQKISQIVVEFHCLQRLASNIYFPGMKVALEKLLADFAVIHVHGNNSAPWLQVGGVALPAVIEVTFANRKIYEFTENYDLFPTELDRPNYKNAPDLFLGSFKWPKQS